MSTFGADIFLRLALPIRSGSAVISKQDPKDKEFFVQNWVESVLEGPYLIERQGRNSHPDYVLWQGDQAEGLEVKSLENLRAGERDPALAPCRTDVDFNSCIPCGRVRVGERILRCYYAFVLYERVNDKMMKAIALAMVDGNFLNRDFDLAVSHRNISKGGFGSYGDAFVRTRKMYRFPNPLTHPDLRYRTIFVTEEMLQSHEDLGLKIMRPIVKRDKRRRKYSFQVYELK